MLAFEPRGTDARVCTATRVVETKAGAAVLTRV